MIKYNLKILTLNSYFLFLVFFLLATVKCVSFLDPDFGYLIQSGNLILKKGIPQTDPFSYTMPSYQPVLHWWFSSIIFNSIYLNLGKLALSALISLLATLALFINRPKFNNHAKIAIFILSASVFLYFITLRPFIISWFLFSLLIFLTKEPIVKKYWIIFPILFMLWANLHGGFSAGLVFLGLWLLIKSVRQKKLSVFSLLVFILSTLGTFLNPYGWRIYGEIIQTTLNTDLHQNIQEWLPAYSRIELGELAYLTFSVFAIIAMRQKIKLEYLVLIGFFLIQAILSMRNIPLYILLSLPWIYQSTSLLIIKAKNYRFGLARLQKVYFYFLLGCLALFSFRIGLMFISIKSYDEANFFPVQAIEYLRQNPVLGNLFAPYNWGGYIIWKYPEKKVFIDGRMPIWQQKDPPLNESANVFNEYLEIIK